MYWPELSDDGRCTENSVTSIIIRVLGYSFFKTFWHVLFNVLGRKLLNPFKCVVKKINSCGHNPRNSGL